MRGAAAALVPLTARIETSLLGERAALRGAIAFARTRLQQLERRDALAITRRLMAEIQIRDVSMRNGEATVALHDS